LLQRFNDSSIKISEFSIEESNSHKSIKSYGAVNRFLLNKLDDKLEIIELTILPVGAGLEWTQVPYSRTLITAEDDSLKVSKSEIILDLSNITDTDIDSFIKDLPNLKKSNNNNNDEHLIGKLLVCSLKGNKKCLEIFNDIDDFIEYNLGAHPRHFYNDCKFILREYFR
jgi:hypothetical protein